LLEEGDKLARLYPFSGRQRNGLAEKKEQGKLTLEDVDEKLDMIIKILQDLMPPK